MLIRATVWLAVFLIAMGQAATLLAADYDMRADIYAVGATMYYLLTGRAPFDAPDLRELFVKVTTDAPVPVRQLRSDVPARLSALVLQCLAKTPARRPSSYPELADALRPFLARDDRPAPLGTRILARHSRQLGHHRRPGSVRNRAASRPTERLPGTHCPLRRRLVVGGHFHLLPPA